MILKRIIILAGILFLMMPGSVRAQSKDEKKDAKKYAEDAEFWRKEVWAWKRPEFEVRTIPERYNDRSSVILARHIDVNVGAKRQWKWQGATYASQAAATMTEVIREVVRMNDKSAVTEYSELSFTQMEKRKSGGTDKTTQVFIGVRVIKPDGAMKEIAADDIVLTKDEKREKQAKVAIPDLQVGDVLDYFMVTQTNLGGESVPPFSFTMYDNAPMLHYSIHCEISKKFAAVYRAYNKAPGFVESKNEEGNIVLDLEKKAIPSLPENTYWLSAYRQLPIVRLHIVPADKSISNRTTVKKAGGVYHDIPSSDIVHDEIAGIAYGKYMAISSRLPAPLSKTAYEHVKKIKKDKTISRNKLAEELWYAYRFDRFLDIEANTDIDRVINFASRSFSTSAYMFYLNLFLKQQDINSKMVLLTSKYGPDMQSLLSTNDLLYMLLIDGESPTFYGITDVFSPAGYIPSYMENTKAAITVDTRGVREIQWKNFDMDEADVPGSEPADNFRLEKLEVTPGIDNSVAIKRSVTLKGHYKSDTQEDLVLFEDFYEHERKLLGQEESLIQQLESGRKTKKYADELKAAFDDARKKQKDAFIADAKDWFESDILDLSDYKVDNLGVRSSNPDFIYSARFNIPGLLKKAGTNFILDIGKLQGAPLKVEGSQRKRFLDVYAPFARSLNFSITVNIPEGYTAEGVANLNKLVENECGKFSCEATTDGKTVSVTISKIYKHNYEPAGNWEKMLAFLDAANEWSNSKLLLKKK